MTIPLAFNALMGLTQGNDLPKPDQEWMKASLGVLKRKMEEDEATIKHLTEEIEKLRD